jgi:hypothetical protein
MASFAYDTIALDSHLSTIQKHIDTEDDSMMLQNVNDIFSTEVMTTEGHCQRALIPQSPGPAMHHQQDNDGGASASTCPASSVALGLEVHRCGPSQAECIFKNLHHGHTTVSSSCDVEQMQSKFIEIR